MASIRTGTLLKYMGLTGTSGIRTGSLVPRARTPDADERLWQDFVRSGEIVNPEVWTKYNTLMKRPTTFEEMLRLWDEMAQWDLIAAALSQIVDETLQTDTISPATLWYECNDKDAEDELNDLLLKLDVESVLPSQVWYIAAMGNHFEKLEYAPNEGVTGMSYVHPMDMRRYWLERNRKCIGFRWRDHRPNKEDVFVRPDNRTPVERVSMVGNKDIEDLWYPWDFLHFRRMYRMRVSEHGEPIFAEADGIYKKLRLAIDQMVVCRSQVQPDRYAVLIDTQEQPPAEQMKTIHRWRQMLRRKLAFGQSGVPGSFNAVSDFTSYYDQLALDTILYIPQPKGFNNSITKLPGTADVPDVYDIELLTDLFYSIIGMPKSWFTSQAGASGGGGEMPSGRALLAQDIRFLRKIKALRRPLITTYQWLGYFHMLLLNKNIEELDIKVNMPDIGSLEDQLKLETVNLQADVLSKMAEVMERYTLPKEAWIELIFKRYMHLPDEVISTFITALPQEASPQESHKTSNPRVAKLLEQVDSSIRKDPELKQKVKQLREVIYDKKQFKRFNRWNTNRVLNLESLRPNDIIVSSFGRHPFEFRRPGVSESRTAEGTKTGFLYAKLNESRNGGWDNDGAPQRTPESSGSSDEPFGLGRPSPYHRWIK